MTRPPRGLAVLAGLLGIGGPLGCADDGTPEATASASSSVQPGAADPALCDEHGVLASVCTQCNPSLAPVFQAKGDWCGEHGFPESFCPVCSPEAGGRPAVQPTGGDGAPAEGLTVRFRTRATAAQAGLEVVAAEAADWTGGTEVVARLDWDPTRVAAVSARVPGLVGAVRADVGDPVVAGQELAVLRSAHVAADRSRLVAARQGLEVAAAEVARKTELLEGGVSAQRELLAAEQALAQAEAELAAVRAELAIVGGGGGDRMAVNSPLDGVVAARHVSVGAAIGREQVLFEVVDPSEIWAVLDVPERLLGTVAVGQPVSLRLDAFPDEQWTGSLAALSPVVDPATRTARARVVLPNSEGRLRANLYGTARVRDTTAQSAVVVPSAAVQRAGEVWLVFVQQAVDRYEVRRVKVKGRSGGSVAVVGSVQPGDKVVTTGSFLLKTETLKDSIGAGCCDVD